MPVIKLKSSENEMFEADMDVVKCSGAIKTMLEDLDMEDGNNTVIPLPNVNSATLRKILQWATYHKDDPQPTEDDESKEKCTNDICQWDVDFLKVDRNTLFDLILAANYMDIPGLMAVCCKTVANMIKGKSTEEIRTIFNIVNDPPPTEEK